MKNINRVFLLGDSWIEGQGTYEKIEGEIISSLYLKQNNGRTKNMVRW